MANIKVFVDNKIGAKKVMVFSKKGCPYCTKAKQTLYGYVGNLLSANDYDVLEIDDLPNCAKIQDYLQEITGGRSVPRVFINGNFVGGGDDVVAKHKDGSLKSLLS